MQLSESHELFDQCSTSDRRIRRLRTRMIVVIGLDDYHGQLVSRRSNSHERRAIDAWVRVDNGFAGLGKERARARNDAVCFAPAVPEAISLVEVAHVPHAVPKRFAV